MKKNEKKRETSKFGKTGKLGILQVFTPAFAFSQGESQRSHRWNMPSICTAKYPKV